MTAGTGSPELELRDYLAVLGRRKLTIALVSVIAVAVALAASFLQEPVYEASAHVLLQPRDSEQIFAPDSEQTRPEPVTRVDTEIEVMRSRSVRSAVADALGHDADVTVTPVGETDVARVRASSADAADAADAANTYAETYIDTRRRQRFDDLLAASEEVSSKIAELEDELRSLPLGEVGGRRAALENRRDTYRAQLDQLQLASELTQTGGAQVISEAEKPSSPARPTPVRNGAMALVAGLALGVGFAFVRDHLDDTVSTKDDLKEASGGLNVLALVPAVRKWRNHKRPVLVSMTDPGSPVAEAYRALRTSVRFLGLDRRMQVLQLTSGVAAEGKTTTVANLGVALARAGSRVALVDCDLRRPRLHDFFEMDNSHGFTSVLLGEVPLASALLHVPEESGLVVLPSGPPPPNPSELLSGRRTRELLEDLRNHFDVILVDTPPVLPVSDARVLSDVVDGVILVASATKATEKDVARAVELLGQVEAPVVGAVLNSAVESGGYGDGYRYGDRYEAAPRPRRGRSHRSRRHAKGRAKAFEDAVRV